MVCKECGAYNADHLTHCRVCAAKLRDVTDDIQVEENVTESGRPSRRFAQAPVWPKQAHQAPAYQAPVYHETEEPVAPVEEEPEEEIMTAAEETVVAEATAPMAEPVKEAEEEKPAVCASCGKPLFAGAPFCAFCGAKVGAPVAAPAVEPVAEKEPAPVVAEEPAVEEVPVAEEEKKEETVAAAVPARSRFGRKPEPTKDEYKDLYEYETAADDEDDAADDDDFDEDDFDDEESFDEDSYDEDDEYDEDEYDEDEEEGGKGKAGAIIFWILIVVLVLLIGGIGYYFAKSKGITSIADLKAVLSGNAPASAVVAEPTASPEPENTVVVPEQGISASITDTHMDDGSEGYLIDVTAPAGSKLHIITSVGLMSDTVSFPESGRLQVKVPHGVFLPDDYADSEIVTVTPQLEVIEADGTTTMLEVPDVTVTLEPITLTLSEPAEDTVEQGMDGGPITVTGVVSDEYAEVTVNGEAVQVYSGGNFQTTVPMTLAEGQTGTIEVVAKKINRVTATKTITVTPYVVKDITLTVTSSLDQLKASTDGTVTISGTVTPGAKMTFTSKEGVVFAEPWITETGNYSCSVTLPAKAYGLYEVEITASAEGYNAGSQKCYLEYVHTSPNTYRKGAADLSKVYDAVSAGTTTSGAMQFTGTVTEIVATEPYTVVKFTLTNGKVVYVANRSAKNVIDNADLKKKKQVAGELIGLYPETDAPYIWGWFIWNK